MTDIHRDDDHDLTLIHPETHEIKCDRCRVLATCLEAIGLAPSLLYDHEHGVVSVSLLGAGGDAFRELVVAHGREFYALAEIARDIGIQLPPDFA